MTATRVWLVVLALVTATLSVTFALSAGWASGWSVGEVSLARQLRGIVPVLVPSVAFGVIAVVLGRESLDRPSSRGWLLLGLVPAALVVASQLTEGF